MAWVVYECKVCGKQLKNEMEVSKPKNAPLKEEKEIKFAEVLQVQLKEDVALKKRKRTRGVQGLKMAIEKRKEEEEKKTVKVLDLTDLMKTS